MTAMDEAGELLHLSQSFEDIDQLCESLEGWDVEFRQLEPGAGSSKRSVIASGTSAFQRIKFNSKVQQFGASPSNAVTFGFSQKANPDFNWCSARAGQSDLMLFPAGEWDCVGEAGFVGYSFSFSTPAIERALDQLGGQYEEVLDVSSPRLISRAMNASLATLRLELDYYFDALEHRQLSPCFESSLKELISEIPFQFLLAANEGLSTHASVQPATRELIHKRARELIHSQSGQEISVGSLCEQLATSRSTLERVFKSYYGIGPKCYIRMVRLHRLHRALRQAPPAARVIDLAGKEGLWHMGQLGRDYARQFGCLPSETLQQVESTNFSVS